MQEPFKSLFLKIVGGLPPEITKGMETEKKLFSRILKNDYGQGGAWPYYWGAIYPRSGSRMKDGQLYMVIDGSGLRYGFQIGEQEEEIRNRFLNNCRQNHRELIPVLEPALAGGNLLPGSGDASGAGEGSGEAVGGEEASWKSWLGRAGPL